MQAVVVGVDAQVRVRRDPGDPTPRRVGQLGWQRRHRVELGGEPVGRAFAQRLVAACVDLLKPAVEQFETAQFLPPGSREELAGELICYGRAVVHQEWPLMEESNPGDTINPWAGALFITLRETKPTTATEQSAYDKWLDQTSDREEGRRDRIHGAAGIIPTSLWLVLFLSAGLVFAYMLFFADSGERARSQAMLMGAATAMVVATLLAITALDNPYGPGVGNIGPVAMERSLRIIDEARVIADLPDSRACDAEGTALES
jgi:hypothetical protein